MVIHQQVGNRRENAYALLNLGLAYWRSDDTRAAREVLEQAQTELAALGDTFGRATGLTYLAFALEQTGEIDSAQWRFERAQELLERMGVHGFATDALAGLARCSLAQGNLNEARRCAGEAWDYLVQQKAQGLEFPTRAFVTCAQVFDTLGETEKSHAAIEEGYWNLISRAEKISNLEWGKFFLTNVPEHRALLDLWERVASPATANSQTQPQKKVEDDKHG
jgi:tetratricopeptide (TPR) repeat protein